MKPHLLLLLLLAIPPLISNILASENAEKSDAPPAATNYTNPKDAPATALPATVTPPPVTSAPVAPAVKTAKPVSGGTSGLKAWYMMW